MKVKQRRDDFSVTEITSFPLKPGKFSVYKLEKSGIGTSEALAEISREWDIPRKAFSYGGRKDRHAITIQTVTVQDGPKRGLQSEKFALRYVGTAQRAFGPKDIVGNRFEVVVRNLVPDIAQKMQNIVSTSFAIPNYFDHQRFGSVGYSGEFAAKHWCLKEYERAVFLALADPNPADSPAEREQKAILEQNWGDWEQCKALLDRSNRRSVVTYLVDHPSGFKKAAALIDRDLRSLLVSAFQSRLWNEMASRVIEAKSETVPIEIADVPLVLPKTQLLNDELQRAIPLPSSRPTRWPADAKRHLEKVCDQHEIKVHQLRFSHPRDVFFSRAERPLYLVPQEPTATVNEDDLASGKSKLELAFQLKPGQYATMLVRGLETLAQLG